jgi:hypothetical protein
VQAHVAEFWLPETEVAKAESEILALRVQLGLKRPLPKTRAIPWTSAAIQLMMTKSDFGTAETMAFLGALTLSFKSTAVVAWHVLH